MHRYNVNTLSYFVMVPMIMITWYYMPICHRCRRSFVRLLSERQQMRLFFCRLFICFSLCAAVSLSDYITCILTLYLATMYNAYTSHLLSLLLTHISYVCVCLINSLSSSLSLFSCLFHQPRSPSPSSSSPRAKYKYDCMFMDSL